MVAAFSVNPQRVTLIVPNVGEHVFEGRASADGQVTSIGEFHFQAPNATVDGECWNEEQQGGQWYNYEFVEHDGNPNDYSLPFGMKGAGSVIFFVVDAPSPAAAPPVHPNAEIEETIKWMWNDTGLCWKPKCVFYVVEVVMGVQFSNGSIGQIFPYTFRGVKSARGCVETAKKERDQGHSAMAIAWLQAGQLHNAHAQEVIAKNADAALSIIGGLH